MSEVSPTAQVRFSIVDPRDHDAMTAWKTGTGDVDPDTIGFTDDPDCPCIDGRCACESDSVDPIDR